METKMVESKRWPDLIHESRLHCEEATNIVDELKKNLEADGDDNTTLEDLEEELRKIGDNLHKLNFSLCTEPVIKMAQGLPMTRNEFYLLCVMDILKIYVEDSEYQSFDPYELFQNLRYEGDGIKRYIDLGKKPEIRVSGNTHYVPVRFTLTPEELQLSNLRPEQRQFIEKYLPEVLARFGKGEKENNND